MDNDFQDQTRRVTCTLEAGEVTRYHATPYIKPQTDGQHSWGVAVIGQYILGPEASYDTLGRYLVKANLHDTGELATGDLPYFVKAANPDLAFSLHALEEAARHQFMLPEPDAIGPRLTAILKVADCLEALVWVAKNSADRPWKTVNPLSYRTRFIEQWGQARDKYFPSLTPQQAQRADNLFNHFIKDFPHHG